jgi:hypothetical protein
MEQGCIWDSLASGMTGSKGSSDVIQVGFLYLVIMRATRSLRFTSLATSAESIFSDNSGEKIAENILIATFPFLNQLL